MKSEADNGQSSRRDQNSLHTLTRKFIKLIYEHPDKMITMTGAAEKLEVGKRRIYDITNVLEALGMISKWSVNSVKWIGGNVYEILSQNEEENRNETHSKPKKEELELDEEIERLNKEMFELSTQEKNLENAFITYEDLEKLKVFNNKLVFAVKAPTDTTMEYPRYHKGAYRMKITTEKGQISVFYVNNDNETSRQS